MIHASHDRSRSNHGSYMLYLVLSCKLVCYHIVSLHVRFENVQHCLIWELMLYKSKLGHRSNPKHLKEGAVIIWFKFCLSWWNLGNQMSSRPKKCWFQGCTPCHRGKFNSTRVWHLVVWFITCMILAKESRAAKLFFPLLKYTKTFDSP